MPISQIPPPHWPGRLLQALSELRASPPARREPARAAAWPVLHAALYAALRSQAGRIAAATREDLEDLASQKALELLLRSEEGAWDPAGRAEYEVAGYVARVARHALIDLARRRGRECPGPEDPEAWTCAIDEQETGTAGPDEEVAAREFARALGECADTLAPRARYAWFRRAFLERPSREIAVRLGVTPAHVDVIVQRARATLRRCMTDKGHPDACMPPGTFVELWRCLGEAEFAGGEELENERD